MVHSGVDEKVDGLWTEMERSYRVRPKVPSREERWGWKPGLLQGHCGRVGQSDKVLGEAGHDLGGLLVPSGP